MTTQQFQQPPQPGRFTPADWNGHLLLCEPERYIEGIMTQNGVTDAVEGTITVLSAQPAPEVILGARVFQSQLVPALREAIGGVPVLGRLGQGQAQPGRSPAWILKEFTPQDAQFASQYLEQRNAQRFQAPPAPTPNSQPMPQPQSYGPPSAQDQQWATQQQYAPAPASGPSHPSGVPSAGPVSVAQPPVAPPAPVPAPAPAPSPQPAAQPPASVLELTAEQLEQMPEETKKLLLGAAYQPPAGS